MVETPITRLTNDQDIKEPHDMALFLLLSLEVSELIALFFVLKELGSALIDRDRAICEKNELLEKCCHEVKDKAEAQKELSQACKDIETVREERDVARKERTEAIIQRDQLLREYYQARQVTLTHLKMTHAPYRYDKQLY